MAIGESIRKEGNVQVGFGRRGIIKDRSVSTKRGRPRGKLWREERRWGVANRPVIDNQCWLEAGVKKRPDTDFRVACMFLPSCPPPLVVLVLPLGRGCVKAKLAVFKNDEGDVL